MLVPRYRVVVFIMAVIALFVLAAAVEAQSAPAANTCPDVVSQALTTLGTSCANVDPNTTCYGHPSMNVAAFMSSPAPTYTAPGDRVPLSQVQAIQTGNINLSNGNWGLNLMNVSANIPTALSPKGVTFVQFGGVEVESGVEPDKAVSGLATGITVKTTSTTNLLTWPAPSVSGHASNVVTSVPSGSSLSVDAANPDGTYVRAVYTDPTAGAEAGWVLKSSLDNSVDLSSLPAIGPDDMNYFQNFYYRSGVRTSDGIDTSAGDCDQSTSLLFVQGPNNAPADLKVFDQAVRIESTMVLMSLPPGDTLGNELELIDLTGLIVVYPDTPDQLIIPPGFKTTIALCSTFESLGIQGDADEKATCGKFTTPVPLTQDELNQLGSLENIPSNVTNYPIKIPIIITASGVGSVTITLEFPDQNALDKAKQACADGQLSQQICQYLNV